MFCVMIITEEGPRTVRVVKSFEEAESLALKLSLSDQFLCTGVADTTDCDLAGEGRPGTVRLWSFKCGREMTDDEHEEVKRQLHRKDAAERNPKAGGNRKQRRAEKAQERHRVLRFKTYEFEPDAGAPAGEVPELVAHLRRTAETRYTKEYPPMQFFFPRDDGTTLFVVPELDGDEDKKLAEVGLAEIAVKGGFTKYAFVLESWTASDGWMGRASYDPDRKETLVIGAVDINGRKMLGYYEVTRNPAGDGALSNWSEHEVDPHAGGWVTNLFEKAAATVH